MTSTEEKPTTTTTTETKPTGDPEDIIKNYWYPEKSVNGREVALKDARSFGAVARKVLLGLAVGAAGAAAWLYVPRWLLTPHALVMYAVTALLCVCAAVWARRRRTVYLLDFSVLRPAEDCKMSKDRFDLQSVRSGYFGEAALAFQKRLNHRTGLGDETYLPRPFFDEHPGNFTIEQAREEALSTITGCCDDLFAKTGVSPREIDFVVFNCSLFCPTPSLAAMVINHYKMRSDVKNFNLGGMGCSAGLVSIDLARDLLDVYPDSTALVFSTENITMNWYPGQVKGMLLSNTLFRVGGAAILLTNKRALARRAKYELVTTQRVITAADDDAHHAIYQMTDPDGQRGVKISRTLSDAVGRAMLINLTRIAPRVLPLSEIARYGLDWLRRRTSAAYRAAHPHAYVPNFRAAFDHFCIHAGGRAIIDGIEKNLHLTEDDCMPSRATLYRYGNASSSSVWDEMNYIEGRGLQKKGDRTFQIAFGSGLKCNTVVWKALHTMPAPGPLPEKYTF